jgi:uncharacterized repeat protein (TIGR02059 family)
MTYMANISSKFKAAVIGVTVVAMAIIGVSPAYAAGFLPTSAATNTAGTQVLVNTSVALDATTSAKIPADFTLTVNGIARASSTYTVTISGNSVVLNLSSGTLIHSDVITVAYARSGSNKIYQQGSGSSFMSNTITPLAVTNNLPVPDTTPPVFTLMSANTAGTNIAITFNEALLTTSIPAASAFVITQNGTTIPNTAYTVAVAGSTVTVTFTNPTITNNTSVFLSYTAPGTGAIKDLAGNAAVSIASNHVTNPVPDTTPPSVTGRATNTAGTTITLSFDELLSTTNVPAPGDFSI